MPLKAINLLPEKQAQQVQVNPYVIWFYKTGAYFLFITYVLVLAAFGFRWYQESQLDNLNRQIKTYSAQISSNLDKLAEFEQLQSRYLSLEDIYSEKRDSLGLFALVEETVPDPITVKDLINHESAVDINGETLDYLAVHQWQHILANDERVANSELTRIGRVKKIDQQGNETEIIEFTFNITLK